MKLSARSRGLPGSYNTSAKTVFTDKKAETIERIDVRIFPVFSASGIQLPFFISYYRIFRRITAVIPLCFLLQLPAAAASVQRNNKIINRSSRRVIIHRAVIFLMNDHPSMIDLFSTDTADFSAAVNIMMTVTLFSASAAGAMIPVVTFYQTFQCHKDNYTGSSIISFSLYIYKTINEDDRNRPDEVHKIDLYVYYCGIHQVDRICGHGL